MSAPLRVCLAAMVAGGPDGLPRYAVALAAALDRIAAAHPDIRLTLLTTPAGARLVNARTISVHAAGRTTRPGRNAPRLIREQILLSRVRADIVHFMDLTGPLLRPRRAFTATVHDGAVARRVNPGFGPAYKRRLCPWAAGHARRLVAVSAFARHEAIELFGADPRKITVLHSGPGFGSPGGGSTGPGPRTGLLFVGSLTPGKNVPFLIRAHQLSGVREPLILAGFPGAGFPEIQAQVAALPDPSRVRVLTTATDDEIDRLYRSSVALLHPSRYEGFGFTPLEAMGRGCPVVCSDIPALREVSGGGAELVPLDNETAWVDAIRRIAHDSPFRADLAARGRDLVRRYSWEATARGLMDVFREVGLGSRSAGGPP